MEKGEPIKGVSASTLFDSGPSVPATYGAIPVPQTASIDFRQVIFCIALNLKLYTNKNKEG